MPAVQVIIDDSTDKTIAGVHIYDRDNGGTFVGESGSSFPASPVAGEWFWRTDETKLYRRNTANTTWETVSASVGAHATTHQAGGADEVSVSGLSGELADDQPPKAHALGGSKHTTATLAELNVKVSDATLIDTNDARLSDDRDPTAHASSHENGGADEVSVAGLSGELADDQPPKAHALGGSKHSADTLANLNLKVSDATLIDTDDSRLSDDRDPTAHASTHQNGGADEISVAGLSGVLADNQNPVAHALGTAHSADTLANLNAKVSDATLIDTNDARLSDDRDPTAHASSHENGGADEISVAGLSGELADDQPPKSHAIAGTDHTTSTLANLNSKISDATLDDSGDPRTDDDAIHDNVAAEISAVTEKASPVSADLILIEDSAAANAKKRVQIGNLPSGGGEANTASNIGTAGVGVYKTKVGVDLQFKKLNAGSPKITVVDDTGNDEVDIDLGSHASTHQNGGADEISVAGLSGVLADNQPFAVHALGGSDHSASTLAEINAKISDGTLIDTGDPRLSDARTPTSHASSHENGGGDEISVAGLSGELADDQPPKAHALGTAHSADTLANLNAKISDATLDDASDPRTDDDAIHDDVSGEISAVTEKTTPVSADVLLIEDSAAANAKKRVQIGNLPGGADPDAIHDNESGEINAITEKTSLVSNDVFLIEDSAASYAKKKVAVTNLPGGVDTTAIHKATAAEISAITEKTMAALDDELLIEDSAASDAKKSLLVRSLPGSLVHIEDWYSLSTFTTTSTSPQVVFSTGALTGMVTGTYLVIWRLRCWNADTRESTEVYGVKDSGILQDSSHYQDVVDQVWSVVLMDVVALSSTSDLKVSISTSSGGEAVANHGQIAVFKVS